MVAGLGRRWGKTTGGVEIVLEAILAAAIHVGWFAHQFNAVRVAWEEFTKRIPPSALVVCKESVYDLQFVNGGRIECFSADNPDSALGRGFDLVVLDEGARIKQVVRDEIVPPMLADRDGKLAVFTTPKGKQGMGAWVYRDIKKAQAKVPGYYFMQGPTTDNPLPGIRAAVAFARDNLPEDAFRQEYLAEFLDHGTGVINLVPVCVLGGSEQAPVPLPYRVEPGRTEDGAGITVVVDDGPCVMGLDLAQRVDWMVASVLGTHSGDLLAMDRYQHLPWEVQVERAAELAQHYNAQVFVDATGLGGPVTEMLIAAGLDVVPVTFTPQVKQTLIQGLQVAVQRKEIQLPWIAEAVAEADTFEAEVMSSGRMRYAAAQGFHDDIVVSLSLAVYGKQRAGMPLVEV